MFRAWRRVASLAPKGRTEPLDGWWRVMAVGEKVRHYLRGVLLSFREIVAGFREAVLLC